MLKSNKQDRLVTLVEKVAREGFSDLAVCVTKEEAITLLRREQRAQRARVVKIVKDELAYRIKRHRDPLEDVSAVAACKSILAKLHGRTP